MAGIELISKSIVKPATYQEPVHSQTIELTPWDLQFLFLGPIQKGLLFLKPTSLHQDQEQENSLIHHLKTSLSRTLDFFPPLAGQLAEIKYDNGTSSFSIACNNAGAEFVHAIAENVTVADILEPVYIPKKALHSFFAFQGGRNYEGVSKPLLAVQVTDLVDGIFIGCTMNHAVGDGTSFWNFFNSWSDISRGSNNITMPSILQRMFLEGTDRPIHIRLPNQKVIEKSITPSSLLQERVFHFAKENIAALKAKANAEIGSSNQISSLQALVGHILLSIIRTRGLKAHQEIYLWLVIGCRSRLQQLPVPDNYFGNAVYPCSIVMQAGEVLEHGLGYAALQMNKMVASETEERAKKFLRSWAKDPEVLTIGSIIQRDASLALSSSPRFNVYGTDFGWGRPMAVRSGSGNKVDGKMTLFPGAEQGSVDIEVCLLGETLERLGNDQDFMGAVTTL